MAPFAALVLATARLASAGCIWDQQNTTAVNTAYPVRDVPTSIMYAQPFIPAVSGPVGCLNIYTSRVGTPPTNTFLWFDIRADSGGQPAAANIGWACAAAAWALPTTPGILSCSISCPNSGALVAGSLYYVVVRGDFPIDPANYANVHGDTPATYPGDVQVYDGSSWSLYGGGGFNLWFQEAPCSAPTNTPVPTATGGPTSTPPPSPTSAPPTPTPPPPTAIPTSTWTHTPSSPVPTRTPFLGACDGVGLDRNVVLSPDRATLRICLPEAGELHASIRNSVGERVRTLFEGPVRASEPLSLPWDLTNDRGQPVASNVYVVMVRDGARRLLFARLAVISGSAGSATVSSYGP